LIGHQIDARSRAILVVRFSLFWFVINLLAFLGTPVGLVWGWCKWAKHRHDQPSRIPRIELAAILSATVGPALFAMAGFVPGVLGRVAGRTGFALACFGIALSFTTSWQMVVAACLTAVGGVMLAFGLRLP
jgi:hypothetical protein